MDNLEAQMIDFQKVKELVLSKLIDEGLLEQDDADEFNDRCQVLVYKGTWFSKWFDNNVKSKNNGSDKNGYYIRIVELKEKEDSVDRLIRRTTSNYDD